MRESDSEGINGLSQPVFLEIGERYFQESLFSRVTQLQRFLRSGVNGRVSVPLFVTGTA